MNVPVVHSKEFSVGWVKQADKKQNNVLGGYFSQLPYQMLPISLHHHLP